MNLNQLKIFYLASKHGNLSLAAQELNITQPAVTKGIQRLQEFYNIKLLNRFGKKLVLTDAGEALYEVAGKIFDLEVQAEESVREFMQKKRGYIRIHASESFGAYYLPSILNTYCKTHPLIRISVSILPTDTIVENVANLKTDIGFTSYHTNHSKVVCREILDDQMVFIAPPHHPLKNKKRLTYMDLSGQSIIVHERGSVPSLAVEKIIRENKSNVAIPLELTSNRAIINAVIDGLGIAMVSRKVAEEDLRMERIVILPFPGPPITRQFYLVYHKDKYMSAVLRRLINRVDEWTKAYHDSLAREGEGARQQEKGADPA